MTTPEMDEYTATLVGLPGVDGQIESPYARTVSGFMRKLGPYRAVTAADDFGAISVWIDDDGQYRAGRFVFCGTRSGGVFPSKAKVRDWLKVELPKISEANHAR